MRLRPRILISLLVAALAGLGATVAGSANASTMSPSTYAARLVSLVNQVRSQHGLAPLTVTSGTSQVAQTWTGHLAAVEALSHNPQLASQLQSHGSPNWTALGENVGVGAPDDPQQLFTAYMNSPEHRANILGARYRFVGIGELYAGGRAWNTMDFVDSYGTTAKAAPAPAPAPAPVSAPPPASAPRTTRTTHVSIAPVGRMAAPAPRLTVQRRPVVRRHAVVSTPVARRSGGVDGNQARERSASAAPQPSVLAVEQTRSIAARLLTPDPHRTPAVALALFLLVLIARRWLRTVAQRA